MNTIKNLIYKLNKLIYSYAIREWEEIVFKNEEKFILHFCSEKTAWQLMNISWNNDYMYFVYVLDDGQHIGDNVSIEEWFKFIKECK